MRKLLLSMLMAILLVGCQTVQPIVEEETTPYVELVNLEDIATMTDEEIQMYDEVIRLLILDDEAFVAYAVEHEYNLAIIQTTNLIDLYIAYKEQINLPIEEGEKVTQIDFTPYLDGNYIFIYVADHSIMASSFEPKFNFSYPDGLIVPVDRRIYKTMADQEAYAYQTWLNSEAYSVWEQGRG